MDITDLKVIEARVNQSREEFLAVSKFFDEKGGEKDAEKITEKFLKKLLEPEPERNDIAKEQTRETIALVKDFRIVQMELATRVMMINLKMRATIALLEAKVLGSLFEGFTQSSKDEEKAGSILDQLHQNMDVIKKAGNAMDEAFVAASIRAASIGERVDQVQRMAANSLALRLSTLKSFRQENIDTSFPELMERIKKTLKEETKSELIKQAGTRLAELVEILWNVHSPIAPILKYLLLLKKAVGPRKINTSIGGTDLMQNLLVILRKENEILNLLYADYEEAMLEMD